MVHRLNRMLIAVTIAAFGVAIASAVATAQTCIIVNGVKVYIDENTYQAGGTGGNVTFESATAIPATGALNESLKIRALTAVSNDPVLGAVNTTLNPGAAQPTTTIVSNNPPNRYPATVTIRIRARATFGGVTYDANSDLVLQNNNVTSVLPFNNTLFVSQGDVTFTAVGGATFTLKAGSSVNVN